MWGGEGGQGADSRAAGGDRGGGGVGGQGAHGREQFLTSELLLLLVLATLHFSLILSPLEWTP